MLSNQGSPYVGRFARGWHRLPGNLFPGQPQTRTGAHPSIERPRERPGGRQDSHLARTGPHQRFSASCSRCARREHVIDEQDARWDSLVLVRACSETPAHGFTPLGASSLGLRIGSPDALEQRAPGDVERVSDHQRERPRLVEPALGSARASERNPGHNVRRAGFDCGHRCPQGLRHLPPAAELQPVHGRARRPLERERGPRPRDGRRRALATAHGRARRRQPAALAPRRREGDEPLPAVVAERPHAARAPRAPLREEDVEHRSQGPNVSRRQ